MNFNELLDYRKSLGYSQLDICTYLGISHPTLIAIEKGRRSLKQIESQKLEKLFKGEVTLVPLQYDASKNVEKSTLSSAFVKEVKLSDGDYLVVTTMTYIKKDRLT